MVTLYITRHGQTLWNAEKRLQGQGNSDLDEKGILGANLLRERFKDIDIDCIVSSPLKRTMDTSKIIKGDKDINIYTDDGLMEIDVGDFCGKTIAEMEKENPELIREILDNPYNSGYPNGENLKQFYDRCAATFDRIVRQHENETILVVAHGGVLKAIEYYVRGEMIPAKWASEVVVNCSLTKYEINGDLIKEVYSNDIEHLNLAGAIQE